MLKKLDAIVRDLLTERFPEALIDRVLIKSDLDSEGDKILRITVVVESESDALDRDSLVGFVHAI